jgi:Fe2+ transport system protein B
MNAHITHNHLHWFDELSHSFNEAIHNSLTWKIAGIAVLVAAFVLLFVFAAGLGSAQSTPFNYQYPIYPMVP